MITEVRRFKLTALQFNIFMSSYYIYFLTNTHNKVLYVGVTNDLLRRIDEHKNKILKGFTEKYNLNKLIYYEEYGDIRDAIIREKQIKGWKRQKKDELINSVNPSWKDLYEEMI